MPTDLNKLIKQLGFEITDKALLEKALTHKSASNGRDLGYERLEFLGDRVLGLCVADMLMRAFPNEPEGALSRRLNALVRQETLAEIATELKLDKYVILGRAEKESGAQHNPAILSDIVEALIAVLFIENGIDAASQFIKQYFEQRLTRTITPPKDAKSSLQEWAMSQKLPLPDYKLVARQGPDHAPLFTIQVSLPDIEPEQAEAESKRNAEQKAAEQLLYRLKMKS